jgi:hypothetical protein
MTRKIISDNIRLWFRMKGVLKVAIPRMIGGFVTADLVSIASQSVRPGALVSSVRRIQKQLSRSVDLHSLTKNNNNLHSLSASQGLKGRECLTANTLHY